MATDGQWTVAIGDVVTIRALGFERRGRVRYAAYDADGGWDIEFVDPTDPQRLDGYGHWKQGFDHGRLVAVESPA